MKKRSLALFMAALTAASLAAPMAAMADEGGTISGSYKGDPVELSFWNGFTSTDGEVLQDIVDDFNERNDMGITIKMDVMPWDTFNEKLPAAIASGTAPDFVLCSSGYYPAYVREDSFQDIEDFYSYDGVNKDDFEPNIVDMLYYNGKCIGIPMQVVTHYLFWDKDLYEAAGLDAENGPSSWEEIVANAKTLTDKSKNQYGMNVSTTDNVVFQYAMYAYDGRYMNDDETKAELNSENNQQALADLKEMYQYSPKDMDDNTFISGQLGQFINGPWIINGLRDNEINFGVKAVPAADGHDPDAAIIPVGFSIPKTTSDNNKQAVYEFVKFWNSTEICTKWTGTCGTPAYLISAEENFKDDPLTSALSVPLKYGRIECKQHGVSVFRQDVLTPLMEDVFNNGKDIKESLDKYNDVMQKMLDEG